MTRPDRERFRRDRENRITWDRAVSEFRFALAQNIVQRGPLATTSKAVNRSFWRTMADCQLAGFATPMEVARGGRA